MKLHAFFLAIGLALFMALAPAQASAQSADPIYTSKSSNIAVGGYDTVAYFTQSDAVKGSSDFQTTYKGAQFLFSSQQNLDTFMASPEKYAPQYGGYCAWAIAHDKTAKGNPKYWAVVDGKLYLNLSRGIQKKWKKNQAEFIQDADTNYPNLVSGA